MKPEAILQMQIVQLLSLHAKKNNFIFFSVPNEAALLAAGEKKIFAIINHLKKLGMTPGVSDIVICKGGQTYFLELKSLVGAISKSQYIFRDNAINCGAMYAVCRDLEQFNELMKGWNIF